MYKQHNQSKLVSAMREALKVDMDSMHQEIINLNREYEPNKISTEFSNNLIEALGWRTEVA